MKKWIIPSLLLIGCIGWWLYNHIDFSKPIAIETYVPSAECAPAYEALDRAFQTAGDDYDIEQTVRIMNSLEVAQSQADSFEDFLEYMARQDYRHVATDVLEAKRMLFPILDEMNMLRRTQKELSSVWYCLRGATRKLTDDASEQGATAYALTLCSSGGATAVAAGVDAAFDAYQEQQELKRKTEKQLNRLRRQYIAYLERYMPVYYKYMDEWNALCLNKDRAYIHLYAGKASEALESAERVLDQHPTNCEGLLLKAVALIRLGHEGQTGRVRPSDAALNQQWLADGPAVKLDARIRANPCYFTAQRTLDDYMRIYPDRAAPALLLCGILEEELGHDTQAMACYEQAAVEYPRQAERLTDLLDAYVNRTYLTQSVEGHYLLNYYRSTMEGAGIFSPNFRKAALLARRGDAAAAREEIYKHFFRRGSQAVQDCLLSDMQYCETNLAGCFRPMVLEQAYIDLQYEPAAKFMGMGKKAGQLKITLANRSDTRIENVRIFLCMHTVGMYKDDYDIIRMTQTRNVIEPYETVVFNRVDISPRQIEDITRLRAIVMTDDKVCWIDDAAVKQQKAVTTQRDDSDRNARQQHNLRREQFMRDLSITTASLNRLIAQRTTATTDRGWLESTLTVRLPRMLALLAPQFTMHAIEDSDRSRRPASNRLIGESIELTFDTVPSDSFDLCLYSEYVSLRIPMIRNSDGSFKAGEARMI